MKPTIIEKDRIILLGFSFFGDPFSAADWTEENEIGRLWKRLEAFLTQNAGQIKNIKNFKVGYEVWSANTEASATGDFDIFVGLEIEDLEGIPVEPLIKILPSTTYAVFTLKGDQITSDWPRMIYKKWLPDSGYQAAYHYNFQFYDERFKGLDKIEESIIDVYVPIK